MQRFWLDIILRLDQVIWKEITLAK